MSHRGNWEYFRQYCSDAPEGAYEPAVFLSNARLHLLNSGRTWSDPALEILLEAHYSINESNEAPA